MASGDSSVAKAMDDPSRLEWFGQPRGLTILFLTEMWEKFSYFGMRAMLVYYMIRQLAIGQGHASVIYGLYTGSVMLTPLLGATLSDRWLGQRRAVILGAAIMAAGHFMMAFEELFYAALTTIALGSGLLLPNLPSQIDRLYEASDPRRNSAFSVYYVGINTGGLLAPLVCGTIGELYGWHWGFATAGAGMIIGLLIYVAGARYLPHDAIRRSPTTCDRTQASTEMAGRYKLLLMVALIVMVFRGSYEQIGNTIALWAEQGIDRAISPGFTIPMTWFQSLNPLLVFVLTPLLVAHWTRQAKKGQEPAALMKMAIGASLAAVAYFLLSSIATWSGSEGTTVHWGWLALFFVIMTAGELFVFPVGLALFARMAPAGFAATAIAVWYLAGFAGNLLGGVFGTLWTLLSRTEFFAAMGAVAVLSAVLFLYLERRLAGARTPVRGTT